MICQNCQKQNANNAKFCVGCGAGLTAQGENKQMAKINGGGNKFLFIAFALALVVIAGVFCLSKGNPLVGAYAKTNNENSGEVHTLTIKDGNHFTKYDNYGGAKNYGFAQTQDAVLENAGTYTKQDKDIDFEWTDSSTKAGQHLSCTVVDEGLDCGITSKDIYRKQK